MSKDEAGVKRRAHLRRNVEKAEGVILELADRYDVAMRRALGEYHRALRAKTLDEVQSKLEELS